MSYGGQSSGGALSAASDVALNSLANGQSLIYNASVQKWSNGAPSGVTAAPGTNTTQLATTAFVQGAASTVVGTNVQGGSSYTLQLGDAGQAVEMTSAGANTVVIPNSAAAAFPVGTVIEICQYGTGSTTIAAASGVTIRTANAGLRIDTQYGIATLRKRAANEWIVGGYLSA